MSGSRRCAALHRAATAAVPSRSYSCEPLEPRVLLASNDPVLVFTEPFSLNEPWPTVTAATVEPWLRKNNNELQWDLDEWDNPTPPWNNVDGDDNGFADDVYGWKFDGVSAVSGTPNIIGPSTGPSSAAHGATIMSKVLKVLNDADALGDRVRIMHVLKSEQNLNLDRTLVVV